MTRHAAKALALLPEEKGVLEGDAGLRQERDNKGDLELREGFPAGLGPREQDPDQPVHGDQGKGDLDADCGQKIALARREVFADAGTLRHLQVRLVDLEPFDQAGAPGKDGRPDVLFSGAGRGGADEAAGIRVERQKEELRPRANLPDLAQEVPGDMLVVLDEVDAGLELLEGPERELLFPFLAAEQPAQGRRNDTHRVHYIMGKRLPSANPGKSGTVYAISEFSLSNCRQTGGNTGLAPISWFGSAWNSGIAYTVPRITGRHSGRRERKPGGRRRSR
jgi:hypothetical protein